MWKYTCLYILFCEVAYRRYLFLKMKFMSLFHF
uniref:Uncharacterized protein n=1 Tax=Anguilla anguilla TaxID=7936 RepID=A0A0E9QPY7_ANGAN